MDTSLIIISLILVCSLFLPFYLFSLEGQKEKKKIRTRIDQIIAKNNLSIYESENWGITYIGIDPCRQKLVFLKIHQTENSIQILDLGKVKEFQIVEKRKVISTNNRKEQLLEQLYLQVFMKNGEVILFNFYDLDENQAEDFEVRRIEKWKTILHGHLSDNGKGSTETVKKAQHKHHAIAQI